MIVVAEVTILSSKETIASTHKMGFDALETAQAAYALIAEAIKHKTDRMEDTVEIVGVAGSLTLRVADLNSVMINDWVKANNALSGMRETYPNLGIPTPLPWERK